jgi:Adenylate kinase
LAPREVDRRYWFVKKHHVVLTLLVPCILQLLYKRIEKGKEEGEKGFVLDGFPRTVQQAQDLVKQQEIQLAVNLHLREEVLIEKCMGRRICKKCGKGWNVADIHRPASDNLPEIIMPPLDPPADCLDFMEQRADDKEEVCFIAWPLFLLRTFLSFNLLSPMVSIVVFLVAVVYGSAM